MAKQTYSGQFSRMALGAWALMGAVALSACATGALPPAVTPVNLPPQPSSAVQPAAASAAAIPQASAAIPAGPVQVARTTRTLDADLPAPPAVPQAITRKEPALVRVKLDVIEREGDLAEGVKYRFWTFGGTVPGPMIRVREGDTVELTLHNAKGSIFPHSIDLHAVTGPGGGAKATQTLPGQETAIRFAALNPGVYVYHCATPNIPQHIANGMYGLIVVDPEEGMTPVDREYYVMQGDFYTGGATGEVGMQHFSNEKMMKEQPEYVLFNGTTGALMGSSAMKAKVGETVRLFFGVGGPNLTSSFHIIGEVLDRVYQEGSTSAPLHNVQTTMVPAGGAVWMEFKVDVPGTYMLVDHSLARLHKGAVASLVVEGPERPEVFSALKSGADNSGH